MGGEGGRANDFYNGRKRERERSERDTKLRAIRQNKEVLNVLCLSFTFSFENFENWKFNRTGWMFYGLIKTGN